MATIYGKPPTEARAMLDSLIDRKFPELKKAGVTVEMVWARSTNDKPPVKHHGATAAATIKIMPLADRVLGSCDARITVDGDAWAKWSMRRRESVLFHELNHPIPQYHKKGEHEGELKRDDHGRPVIKNRPDDWSITGFRATVREYGKESIEYQSFENLRAVFSQLHFDWTDDQATADSLDSTRFKDEINGAFAAQGAGKSDARPFPDDADQPETDPDET